MENTKKKIRKILQSSVKAMSLEDRKKESHGVCQFIQNLDIFKACSGVMLYMPITEKEIDIWPLAEICFEQWKRSCCCFGSF